MKFAFVSRKVMNDSKKHVVLATHTVKTLDWAKQLNLSMDRMWSIIRRIVDEVERDGKDTYDKESENVTSLTGEYILLKDFNKLDFRLYKKDMDEGDEEENEDE
jgi:translation initiation factor 3 subunit D